MKRINLLKGAAVVLIILIGLVVYRVYNAIEFAPDTAEHPASVPQEAFWVGGMDGGVFVYIQKRKSDDIGIYFAEIFYEDGSLAYKGRLALSPALEILNDYANKEIYSGWDGDNLLLIDGRFLKTLDEFKLPGE